MLMKFRTVSYNTGNTINKKYLQVFEQFCEPVYTNKQKFQIYISCPIVERRKFYRLSFTVLVPFRENISHSPSTMLHQQYGWKYLVSNFCTCQNQSVMNILISGFCRYSARNAVRQHDSEFYVHDSLCAIFLAFPSRISDFIFVI